MKRAEITAFLSLTFLLLVSFILGILEISIIHTSKNMDRLAVDRSIFSVFGEYQKNLLQNYHIFAIEGTYGTGNFTEDRLISRMHYYGTGDIEHEIKGIQYLTDRSGKPFKEQVLEYMEKKYGISLIKNFTGLTEEWSQQSMDGKKIQEKENHILEEYEQIKSMAQQSEQNNKDLQNSQEEFSQEMKEENPFMFVEKIEKTGLLSMVLPEKMDLSGKAVRLQEQASNRSLTQGYGTFPERQRMNGIEEKLLFNEYILQNFKNAAMDKTENPAYEKNSNSIEPDLIDQKGSNKNDQKESGSLEYEAEYIIAGKASDKENLEAVLMKIFLVRMALNYVYLLEDKEKQGEAAVLATAVTTILLIPEASEALKQLLLLVWSAGESVIDIRALLSGKRVPISKSKNNWQLSLSSLLTLGIGQERMEGEDVSDGISYDWYLRMFMFLENDEKITMRTLDRIEENMQTEWNLDYMKVDQCITKAEIHNTSQILKGITYQFPVYFGYQ